MYGSLTTFASWLQNTPYATAIAGSLWAYPFVQLTHFTGLSIWLGTNFAVDLHALGVVKNTQTTAQLQKSLFAWNWAGFGLVFLGGFTLFSTAAVSFVANKAFETKLGALVPAALIWHIILQVKMRTWGQTKDIPQVAKLASCVELIMWVCAATAAALIPYF
jgi:hypothetical protein